MCGRPPPPHQRSFARGSGHRVPLIPCFAVMGNNSKKCPIFQYVLYKLRISIVRKISKSYVINTKPTHISCLPIPTVYGQNDR